MKFVTGRVACTLICALMLAACPFPSFAAIVDYTDSALWTSHVSILSTLGFDGTAPAGTYTYIGGNSYSSPNVTISAPLLLANNLGAPYYDWPSRPYLETGPGQTLLLEPITTAIGFELFIAGSADHSVTIVVNTSGETKTYNFVTPSKPGTIFFGVTNDTPFSSITIKGADSDAKVSIDNVSTGTPNGDPPPPVEGGEVPEATTWLLCGAGLFGVGMLRRRALRQ